MDEDEASGAAVILDLDEDAPMGPCDVPSVQVAEAAPGQAAAQVARVFHLDEEPPAEVPASPPPRRGEGRDQAAADSVGVAAPHGLALMGNEAESSGLILELDEDGDPPTAAPLERAAAGGESGQRPADASPVKERAASSPASASGGAPSSPASSSKAAGTAGAGEEAAAESAEPSSTGPTAAAAGGAAAKPAGGPGQRQPRGQRAEFCLLEITVSMPGRNFPVWKVAINAQNRLEDVLRRWVQDYLGPRSQDRLETQAPIPLPEGLVATAGVGGPPLGIGERLSVLRPLLPVQRARLAIAVKLPAESVVQEAAAADGDRSRRGAGAVGSSEGRSKLDKLRISTRYAAVDGEVMGFHQSTTMRAKIEAGVYQWNGQYMQRPFMEAMRLAPEPTSAELTLDSRELFVFPEKGGSSAKPLFRATLRGPVPLIANWEATCERLAADPDALSGQSVPFPTFIPTRGRPQKANLNWEADHVYGPPNLESKAMGTFPVVCIVVEPREEQAYRDAWPLALTLVLPANGCGPGFARWAIQRVCTRAHLWMGKPKVDKGGEKGHRWQVRRLPFIWIADDGVSMFYRLSLLGPDSEQPQFISERIGAQRVKERLAPKGARMFREAFLAVQKHAFLPKVAVAGFLRDDGTAVCKKLDWKANELSLYKVVLLNLPELQRLGVEYLKDLQMYEDICLTHQVLRNGGRTLKCQSFCYWASHSREGGCNEQRIRRSAGGTQITQLVSPTAFAALSSAGQQAVRELHRWVRSKELMSLSKSMAGKEGGKSVETMHGGVRKVTVKLHRVPKEAKKRERDYKAEYARRKRNRLEREAALRAQRRALGLPSSDSEDGRRRRRRRGSAGEAGSVGDAATSDEESSSTESSTESSILMEDGASDG